MTPLNRSSPKRQVVGSDAPPLVGVFAFFLICFFYIFGWRFFGVYDYIQLISAAFALYLVLNFRYRSNGALVVLICFALMLAFGTVSALTNGGQSFETVFRPARAALTFAGGVGLVIFARQVLGAEWVRRLLGIVFLCLVLHAFIMFAMYWSSSSRTAVLGLTRAEEFLNVGTAIGAVATDGGFRVPGLTYGLASTSVLQASGALIGFWLITRQTMRQGILTAVGIVACVSSSVLAGRSGFFVLILTGPVWFTLFFMIGERAPITRIFAAASTAAALGALLFLPYILLRSANYDARLSYTLSHLLEVGEFFGGQGSRTLDSLLAQTGVVPTDPLVWLIGTGEFGRGAYVVPTDIGYLLHLWAFGLFGAALFWTPLLLIMSGALRFLRLSSPSFALILCLALFVIIFNLKEDAIYERCMWSVISLVAASLLPPVGKSRNPL